jgi:replicative DNA helicase
MSLVVDLAISLGTGTPFLGTFEVPRQRRVAVVCGKRGETTVQETVEHIAAAKNVRVDKDCLVVWSCRLPQLSRPSHHDGLRRSLAANKIEVAFLDSLYMGALLDASQDAPAANLYEVAHAMGPLLLATARVCLAAGTTPLLVSLMRKTAKTTTKYGAKPPPPDLVRLCYANIKKFARQLLLVDRRTSYQPGSGTHRLALRVDGMPREEDIWDVDIDEGLPGEDGKRREWQVQVRLRESDENSADD